MRALESVRRFPAALDAPTRVTGHRGRRLALLGSHLIVQLYSSGYPMEVRGATKMEEYRRLVQSVRLGVLLIRLPGGIVMQFDSDNLKSLRTEDGSQAYYFTFPESTNALIEATRYDQFKELRHD